MTRGDPNDLFWPIFAFEMHQNVGERHGKSLILLVFICFHGLTKALTLYIERRTDPLPPGHGHGLYPTPLWTCGGYGSVGLTVDKGRSMS